jgi:hypothetical protein
MIIKNAIRIGKGIGKFLELDNNYSGGGGGGLICRQFVRFKIEVNTSKPLASGFYITRSGMDHH